MTQLELDFGTEPVAAINWNSDYYTAENYTQFYIRPNSQLMIANITPDYNMCFHRSGKEIGRLDFNGPELVFTGEVATSARVFLDYLATCFKTRLEQEYNNGLKDGQNQNSI